MGPLSLDLIHIWAQSENRDPTICIFKSFLQFGHSKLWLTPPKEFKNLNYEPLKKKKKKKTAKWIDGLHKKKWGVGNSLNNSF